MAELVREITIESAVHRETRLYVTWETHVSYTTKSHDFYVRQGDDLRIIVEVSDQDGDPVNLQDVQEIRWAAASDIGAAVDIKKKLTDTTIELGAANAFFFDLTPADTVGVPAGKYYHEAEIVTDQGKTYTVLHGTMRIVRQLVRDF